METQEKAQERSLLAEVGSEACDAGEVRGVRAISPRGVSGLLADVRGQGTTEYAILVGVLVVIAILAIIAFRGKVQALWDAIVGGMNAL